MKDDAPLRSRSLRRSLRTLFTLPMSDILLLFETLLWLMASMALVKAAPVATISWLASRPITEKALSLADRRRAVKRVCWAVAAWTRRIPWRAVCIQQGLTAHLLLRRRGLASTLYYGVARQADRGLVGHVWVRQGDLDVVGCETAATHQILSVYPSPAAIS